jgi:transposase
VRVTTAFNRLLKLDGANVTAVQIGADTVVVEVRLRRRKLLCPVCGWVTSAGYDTRAVASSWRHLRLGAHRLVVRARLRRLCCPAHAGVEQNVGVREADSGSSRGVRGRSGRLGPRFQDSWCREEVHAAPGWGLTL